MRRRLRSTVGGIIAAAAWYALALQFSVLMSTSTDRIATFFRFFGHYTILTNTLVALVLTVPTLPLAGTDRFARPGVRTAAATYIAIVLVVYVMLLREPWSVAGAQALTDLILHKIVPILYVSHWLLFEPHGRVSWRAVWAWLEYPAAYLAYGLVTGAVTGFYLYPFLDIRTVGTARVVLGSTVLLVTFVMMGTAIIAVDKALARWTPKRAAEEELASD
jgi:hypothetical protein